MDKREFKSERRTFLILHKYSMSKCTITVCTVHVHRIRTSMCKYLYSYCWCTILYIVQYMYLYIQTLSVNQWERRKNGKYKYADTKVGFYLMHATKVSCNVVLLEIPICKLVSHCTALHAENKPPEMCTDA